MECRGELLPAQLFALFAEPVDALGHVADQFRAGAHLTDIKLGPAKVTLSGGWMRERSEGSGWYTTGTIDFSF